MNAYQMPTSYGVLLILTTWCVRVCAFLPIFSMDLIRMLVLQQVSL